MSGHTYLRVWLTLIFVVSSISLISGQGFNYSGLVFDKNTERPIPGAHVIIKGTTTGTTTNEHGYFHFNQLNGNEVLVISHISYKTALFSLPSQLRFKVSLERDTVSLATVTLYPPAANTATPHSDDADNAQPHYRDFEIVENNAVFPGGTTAIATYLQANYRYPDPLTANNETKAEVIFEVDTLGQARFLAVRHNDLPDQEAELQRLINEMPLWKPARQEGAAMPQYVALPVHYGFQTGAYSSIAFFKKLSSLLHYPDEARRAGVSATVGIYFEIYANNRPENIRPLTHEGYGLEETVIEALQKLPSEVFANLKKYYYNHRYLFNYSFQTSTDFPPRFQPEAAYDDFKKQATLLEPGSAPHTLIALGISSPARAGENNIPVERPFGEFTSVDEAILNYRIARLLILKGQNLDNLPPEIAKLKKLRYLDIERTGLTTLPEVITSLTGLYEFYAPYNQLSALPDDFDKLKNLVIVGLAFNNFTTIPTQLYNLRKLQALDLSHNNLSSIPEGIGQLKHLRILYLQDNQISKLPVNFFKLPLVELDISGNQLSDSLKRKIKAAFPDAQITF